MLFKAQLKGKTYQIILDKTSTTWEISLEEEGGGREEFSIPHKDFEEADGVMSFLFQNHSYLIDTVRQGVDYEVYTRGSYRKVKIFNDEMLLHESLKSGGALRDESSLNSGMPGRIVKILVQEGDEIPEGTPLLIMEAMKMENEMKASRKVKVKKILVAEGDNVEASAPLISFF